MKFKIMTLLALLVAFSAVNVNAQNQDEARVKIMPTGRPGLLKLIHAIKTDKPVKVTFSNATEGLIATDRITGSFPKGILKLYNIEGISSDDFKMEITSANLEVTYRIVPSKDRKTFTAYLEKSVHNHDVVVASAK